MSTPLNKQIVAALYKSVVFAALVTAPTLCPGAPGMEPISLPPLWDVKLDPDDVGVQEEWFSRGAGDGESEDWQSISTHKWTGWDKQGMPEHVGFAWYRTRLDIPETSQSNFVYLYFSAVDEEAWVWVNNLEAGEHTAASEDMKPGDMWEKPFFLDITAAARFGQPNEFAVRIRNHQAMGGIWQPVHLFVSDQPLTFAAMKERADALNQEILRGAEDIVRYEVWTGYPYDPIFPDSVPESLEAADDDSALRGSFAHNRSGPFRVEGACGELVPMAVHVRNLGGAPLPCRIDFRNVRHADRWGFDVSGDRVEVHEVDFVITRAADLVPDPLPRAAGGNILRVPPGQTRSFFILIDTHALPAGPFRGHVLLTPLRSGPVLEIPFELDVAPVVLPERMPIWIGMWSYPPRMIHARIGRGGFGRYEELMRRVGVNTVITRSYGMPWPVLDDRGNVQGINWLDFDQMLEHRNFDFERDLFVIGVFPEAHKEEWGSEFLSDAWSQNYIDYVRMLAAHVRDNLDLPYDDWAIYLEDEGPSDHFITLGKLTREADPKIRIWANPQAVGDLEAAQAAEPYIDIFVPPSWGIGRYPEAENLMREKGKEQWMYTNAGWQPPNKTAVPRNDPHAAHRKVRMDGWLAWKHGRQGVSYWIYVGKWGGRYSGMPDYKWGADPAMVYLGHDGPVTTRRLEAWREGLEDYKLLWIVDRAAGADGQNPALAREARAHIDAAVEEVLAGPRTGEKVQRWRHTLLEDAGRLYAAAPLEVKIVKTRTTRHSVTLKLAASKPVRAWVWHRGDGVKPTLEQKNSRLVASDLEAKSSHSLEIRGLVPGQRSEFTIVVAGPEGQQRVLEEEVTTKDW